MNRELLLWSREEAALRRTRLAETMRGRSIDALLVCSNTNIYYLTGRVFAGYILLTADSGVTYFVKRPVDLEGESVVYVRKPEQIPEQLGPEVMASIKTIGIELAQSYSTVVRLKAQFPDAALADASAILLQTRAVKTSEEVGMIAISGTKHDRVYGMIPGLYRPGMTDIELQVEVEHAMRSEGCLGQLRVSGESMEIHMGNLLAGDNADVPSPYDFTMGGAGISPALPVGADGSMIKPHQTVMADMNGNFNGYMTDMSRVYALGEISELAVKAHQCSIDICHRLAEIGKPGFPVKDLYAEAERMVEERGLRAYFMGHKQHASFIGHGVGIEINELPVVTARSRDILQENNVIALEPKFVIPGVGAVGIENTYVVTPEGMRSLNHAEETIVNFE